MGFIGSSVNAFAGGGTFLAFPALLWAGLPPIIANATCKIAFIPGNIASAFAYRHYFSGTKHIIISMLVTALVGGTIGALLTLYMGNETFKIFIPWLILGATLLTWRGSQITKLLQRNANSCMNRFVNLFGRFLLMFTSIYGGFFGAGIGVLLIATLNLRNITDINAINAIKNVMSVLINVAAMIMYIVWGVIDWHIAIIQMTGAIAGGYAGGVIGRSLKQQTVRTLITIVGLLLSVVYFYKYGYFSFLL
jgi:uncharacterized membrane protein YfcA